MKAVVVQPNSIVKERDLLKLASGNMSAGTARLDASQADATLKEVANNSTSIYVAICEFYTGDTQSAYRLFKAVATKSTGSERARAINNAGFAAFVLGNLRDARADYTEAYEAEPHFTYVTANLAYVTLAEGDIASARKAFVSIANDVDLERTSPEDVLLSKLMLIELDHEAGIPLAQVIDRYAALVRSHNGATWEIEPDEQIRYALLAHESILHIYLGGNYFGLEMFALSTACKARQIAVSASPGVTDRKLAIDKLTGDIAVLTPRVGRAWLLGRHKGWFAHLDICRLRDDVPRSRERSNPYSVVDNLPPNH